MAIPKEILMVERPKNTVVKYVSGFYYVVKRTSVYKEGRRVPKDLGVVGKIIDGKFVEKENVVLKNEKEIDIKSYGEIALYDKVSKPILEELKECYDDETSLKLYVIALLRATSNSLANRDLKHEYENSFLSVMYPKIALSESLIPTFLEDIGKAYLRIEGFMRNRVLKSIGDTVLVDGTLKNYNSKQSMFSDWSRKGRIKGSKDFSLLYSYDITTKEPIASKPYTGNMLDSTAFIDFIEKTDSKDNLFILDKGFWNEKDIKAIKNKANCKYIIPIKNNSKIIDKYNMLNQLSLINNYQDDVLLHNKVKVEDKIYYIFKSKNDSIAQENAYLEKAKKDGTFDYEKYQKKQNEFGIIIFESNYDTKPLDIYLAYQERWNIEIMFKFYKNILDIESSNVKDDYRLYATEFINYLSLIMACKVRKELEKTNLLEKYSYKQIMRYLSKVKKCRVFSNRQEWVDNKKLKYIDDIVKILNI